MSDEQQKITALPVIKKIMMEHAEMLALLDESHQAFNLLSEQALSIDTTTWDLADKIGQLKTKLSRASSSQ